MMSPEVSNAVSHVNSSNYDGDGRVCDFYKVSDNSGAKVYRSLRNATRNMNSQKSLHELGFAPEVRSDVISFKDYDKDRYMFLTELATTVKEICIDENVHADDCDDHDKSYNCDCDCYISDHFYNVDRFFDVSVLMIKLSKLNLEDDDEHWGNYGYLKDGTPVVIDCEFYHGD